MDGTVLHNFGGEFISCHVTSTITWPGHRRRSRSGAFNTNKSHRDFGTWHWTDCGPLVIAWVGNCWPVYRESVIVDRNVIVEWSHFSTHRANWSRLMKIVIIVSQSVPPGWGLEQVLQLDTHTRGGTHWPSKWLRLSIHGLGLTVSNAGSTRFD